MAHMEKATHSAVSNILRHDERTIRNSSNPDIDFSKTGENYNLTPYIPQELKDHYNDVSVRAKIRKMEYVHYTDIKDHCYCYNRKDVNTLVMMVVTLPAEITDPETERKFFQGATDFLNQRYGNIISAVVHKDEGKHIVISDSSGKTVKEFHAGRPHLHVSFVPVVPIDHEEVLKKKHPVKAMLAYDNKISAKDLITRHDLITLHPDMNKYINNICHIPCNLTSGITMEQGGNKSVKELKREFDQQILQELTLENEHLRKQIKTLEHEREQYRDKDRENRKREIDYIIDR